MGLCSNCGEYALEDKWSPRPEVRYERTCMNCGEFIVEYED